MTPFNRSSLRPLLLLSVGTLLMSAAPTSVIAEHDAPVGDRSLWKARHGATADDDANALGVSPDGSTIFVTGQAEAPDTVAYEAATGRRLWASHFEGSPVLDVARALAVGPDGSQVFVTGFSIGYLTVAHDALTGRRLWGVHSSRHDYDDAEAIGVSPDGSVVFITGSSLVPIEPGLFGWDYLTVALDADSGAELWATRYDAGVESADYGHGLQVSPDGSRVFVTGASYGGPANLDFATVAYDAATGDQLWVSRWDSPGQATDSATDVTISPDGSTVIVAGTVDDGDYGTVAYDAVTGVQRWIARWDSSLDDTARDIEMSPDGSTVYVTGDGGSGEGYGTVAYDVVTGARRWFAIYSFNDTCCLYANALALDPTGAALFVTGASHGDIATVAYQASTGEELWVERNSRRDGGGGEDIGVSPDGSAVYVAASLDVGDFNVDYLTIAYHA